MAMKSSTTAGSKSLPRFSRIMAIDFCVEKGSLYGLLEVRASNTSARALMRPARGVSVRILFGFGENGSSVPVEAARYLKGMVPGFRETKLRVIIYPGLAPIRLQSRVKSNRGVIDGY